MSGTEAFNSGCKVMLYGALGTFKTSLPITICDKACVEDHYPIIYFTPEKQGIQSLAALGYDLNKLYLYIPDMKSPIADIIKFINNDNGKIIKDGFTVVFDNMTMFMTQEVMRISDGAGVNNMKFKGWGELQGLFTQLDQLADRLCNMRRINVIYTALEQAPFYSEVKDEKGNVSRVVTKSEDYGCPDLRGSTRSWLPANMHLLGRTLITNVSKKYNPITKLNDTVYNWQLQVNTRDDFKARNRSGMNDPWTIPDMKQIFAHMRAHHKDSQ